MGVKPIRKSGGGGVAHPSMLGGGWDNGGNATGPTPVAGLVLRMSHAKTGRSDYARAKCMGRPVVDDDFAATLFCPARNGRRCVIRR